MTDTNKIDSPKKKLKPLKQRVADAVAGKGGARGNRKVNEDGLNAQQEKFCQLFASDREFFGNGTQSYIEAYNVKVGKGKGYTSYETCRFRAHQLLTKANILKRINQLVENDTLNDAFVDKQLAKLITQDAEFTPKLGAIKEYNALKKRITNVFEHNFGDLEKLSDKELEAEIARLEKTLKKK